MSVLFHRVALIGIGLMGSSLARALRQRHLADEIVGFDQSDATRQTAKRLGLLDQLFDQADAAVENADLVILCVPVGACGAVAETIGPKLKPGAILTDVGSVKSTVVRDVSPHVPAGVQFIPGHPIAGTEQSGPEAGFAEMFEGRWSVLTPLADNDPAEVKKLEALWRACGSEVELMTPEHHDRVLAITSHLPHLIAYNIVATAGDFQDVTASEVIKFSAGGFRDFTRIAASDPVMWRDIFLNNREAVLEMLGRFSEDLSALQRAIRWGEGDKLHQLFSRSRELRRSIIAAGQESPLPNFGRNAAVTKKAQTSDSQGDDNKAADEKG